MAILKHKRLKKELGLRDVIAIGTGTTLSAGFFLLPGIAAQQAGSAIVLAYALAAVPLIPAMFSIVELATAMPRAGGVYYYLDRTMGPLMGTIGGIGTWLALILKVSFALVGMGVYISLFLPETEIIPIAVGIAVLLGVLNLFGTQKSGSFQSVLVAGLLIILIAFLSSGIPEINFSHFQGFFDPGSSAILATTGMVYISYVGVTQIASLSEEVKDPERNLPRGIFFSLGAAFIIYILGTAVMVGVLPIEKLVGNLSPVASTAEMFWGRTGMIVVSIAAIFAFISVANGGSMSASRYPLGMSRDHIIPSIFRKLDKRGIPLFSIAITTFAIILIIVFLDPMGIAKLASAFQLLMFAFVCLAVIVMRESQIESYDPGYHSPFYPWLQIFGFFASMFLIVQIGWLSTVFSASLILLSIIWYIYYVRKRVVRTGAIFHVFERLGRNRFRGLDQELRGILKEKGLRQGDPFEQILARSTVIDLQKETTYEELVPEISKIFANIIPHSISEISELFLEGTRIGETPVTHDVALPHFRSDGIAESQLVLVRALEGVWITYPHFLGDGEMIKKKVNAVFFFVSPEDNPSQHLRILAQVAERVDDESFAYDWKSARDDNEIKEVLIKDDSYLNIYVDTGKKTALMINTALKDIPFAEGCLVAIIHRVDSSFVPTGKTIVEDGDRLVVIGEPQGINELRKKYCTP